MFIFIPLFEVVAALRVSFDALMNGLFSCDAQKDGNYDSRPPLTLAAFLSPVILLILTVTLRYLFDRASSPRHCFYVSPSMCFLCHLFHLFVLYPLSSCTFLGPLLNRIVVSSYKFLPLPLLQLCFRGCSA